MQPTPLSSLIKPPEYREQRQHLFPSKSSLDWFIRQHKSELVTAGALLMVVGQWHVHAEKFDAAVLDIGAKLAQRRLEAA